MEPGALGVSKTIVLGDVWGELWYAQDKKEENQKVKHFVLIHP